MANLSATDGVVSSGASGGGNIPEPSSYGSQPSTFSTHSNQSNIKEMLDQCGYLHCILQQNRDGEWVIRAVGGQEDVEVGLAGDRSFPVPAPPTPAAGAQPPSGRPAWAGPFSGEIIPASGAGGAISPRDYINLLYRMVLLNRKGTDLNMRMRTLHIPSPIQYGLRLFDDDQRNDGREREWVVLTSGAHRPNDDWGTDYPQGYKLRPSSHRSGQAADYYDNVMNELLYPREAEPSAIEGLPCFVLLIGRVGLRYKEQRQLPGVTTTAAAITTRPSVSSYIVVMDVALPNKPLWLVHDAYTMSEDEDLPDERQDAPGLSFVPGGKVFDIAPLADSIGEWDLGSIGGDGDGGGATADIGLNLGQVSERIAAGGRLVKPLISMTWHSRVVDAVRKGYGRN